jgi:cupin fold WbuC family metalloprotein
MIVKKETLVEFTMQAKKSNRIRMNKDTRNSTADQSQRMLNALEPGTIVPIHRYTKNYRNGVSA